MTIDEIISQTSFSIACVTEEDAIELCNYLYERGFKWGSGLSLNEETHYKHCKECEDCGGIIYHGSSMSNEIWYSGYRERKHKKSIVVYVKEDFAEEDFEECENDELNAFLHSIRRF